MSERYLVTGGLGFIGSHLVDAIIARGDEVVILDALSWGSSVDHVPRMPVVGGGALHRIGELPRGSCVVVGDVADAELARVLAALTHAGYHLAAQTHVDRSYGDVMPFAVSNAVGSASVLQAYREAGKRLVYVSTDEVYGDCWEGSYQESQPLAPRNVYSALKAAGDLLAQNFALLFGVDVVIARPSNNYGPRQFPEKLVPRIATDVLAGRQFPIFGDGGQERDWVWVGDTVAALLALMERGTSGRVYNIGVHQHRTVRAVAERICSILGARFEDHVEHVEDRVRGDRRYSLDSSRIQAEVGWAPTKTFDAGIVETVEWYRRRCAAPGGASP